MTLVWGSRLTEERSGSVQTWYVGTTFGQSILESKSGGNRIAVKIVSRGYCVQSGPFLTLVRGARLSEERTDSAQTRYVCTTFGQSILESKSGGTV